MPADALKTGEGTMLGTVAYMSPEQLRGEALDARTDLFSLGLVLYEAATGRRPFSGTTTAVVAAGILHGDPAAPRSVRPELPAQLEHVILRAVEKDQELRYQTASDLRSDLKRLKRAIEPRPPAEMPAVAPPLAEGTAAASQASDSQIVVALAKRHRATIAAAALAVVVAVAAAIYLVVTRSVSPASAGLSLDRLQAHTFRRSDDCRLRMVRGWEPSRRSVDDAIERYRAVQGIEREAIAPTCGRYLNPGRQRAERSSLGPTND